MFKITPCSNSSLSRLDNFCPYAPVLSVPSGLYIVEGLGADKTVPISIRSEISRGPPSSRVSSAAPPLPIEKVGLTGKLAAGIPVAPAKSVGIDKSNSNFSRL